MLYGFGNHHESEAIPNSLPRGQNSPQICPFNLYAEQLNGTAFTAPRAQNLRSWLYRKHPSVGHEPFQAYSVQDFSFKDFVFTPNQLRWSPFDLPTDVRDFVDGLKVVAGAGDPSLKDGTNILVFSFSSSMTTKAFHNSDGDFLIVPQLNSLEIQTEFGHLTVEPHEICVIPRGVLFKVVSADNGPARGYIMECFNGHFELPDLGPIGANGLANPQDFEYPEAAFDVSDSSSKQEYLIVNKFGNQLWSTKQPQSPFNVVAWRGNYAPFKYNLNRFNAMNSVTWDHPDPSIFTVLTCRSAIPGTAIADFVIFPPRWQVAEHTFRPPYFHRNAMTEFMGLISGTYEAKAEGFLPGGASLHPLMSPHGPDSATFQQATANPTQPQIPTRVADGTLAFMFESSLILGVSPWALNESGKIQSDYHLAWKDLPAVDV